MENEVVALGELFVALFFRDKFKSAVNAGMFGGEKVFYKTVALQRKYL